MVNRVGQHTQWRGQPDTARWRLRLLILLSALLHTPLSPLGALTGLVVLLDRSEPAGGLADLNAITAIPIELRGEEGADGQQASPAPDEVPPAEPDPDIADDLLRELEQSLDELSAIEPEEPPTDAGVQPEADAQATDGAPELDAAVQDGGAVAEEAGAMASLDAGAEAGPAGFRDPIAMAGSAGQIADANANVRFQLYMSRIRSHPVGARVRELLRNTPQWQDFFGTGGIDPVADVDQILIAGPQLRKSAEVVAVLQYNASRRKVRRALDRLVRRGGAAGSWLDAGVPAARARADGAERVFVMPVPNIVVVGPPSISQQALSLPSDFHFDPPAGAEALGVHLVTPHRALLGLPFSIPSSLKWARINITPTAAGGAIARAVAEDESEQAAKATAATLKRLLAPYLVLDFIERIDFHAQGANVYGEVEATERQLAFLLELARQQQQKYAQAQAQRQQAKRGPASVSGPRSPAGARSAAPSSASGAQPRTATPPAGSASGRPSARP